MRGIFRILIIGGLLVVFLGRADALLIEQGKGPTDDRDRKADARFAKRSNMIDAEDLMTWDEANAWAGGSASGGLNKLRFQSNPTTLDVSDSCLGVWKQVCKGSEVGHLLYRELGGGSRLLATSGSEHGVNPAIQLNLDENRPPISGTFQVDARTATVPEPKPLILIGLGLIGVAFWRKQRAA